MHSAQTDKNAVEWNFSGAQLTTQQTQPNIVISNHSLNTNAGLWMWGLRPVFQATTRLPPWTYSQWKQMGWRAQWQIIVIMVTQLGRVMENVPCQAMYHGSFTVKLKAMGDIVKVQKNRNTFDVNAIS